MKEGEITDRIKFSINDLQGALGPFGLEVRGFTENNSPFDCASIDIPCWVGTLTASYSPYVPVRIQKNGPATIVFWLDGTKTIVKRGADEPDSDYAAFTAALGVKIFGSNSALKKIVSRTETQKPKVKGAQKVKATNHPDDKPEMVEPATVDGVYRWEPSEQSAEGEQNEQNEQNEPQSAEQTEDVALIEKVAAKFDMTAEQALIAIKAARKQNEQKRSEEGAQKGGAECQNTPV